jgi:hypothetical protein
MTLPGKLIEAPEGLRGFDANTHISHVTAKAFRDAVDDAGKPKFRFCIRYVPRWQANPGDLTMSEAAGILAMGLGLMIVQHVKSPPWKPTGALGKQYGAFAASQSIDIGIPAGCTVWCDLEGTAGDPRDVDAFCRRWFEEVGGAGYTPGLYVGFDPGLDANQLYRLPFEHYWSAYNLNRDQVPAVRGVQMKQGIEQVFAGVRYDPDTVERDLKGGLPLMHVDNEFTP